MTDICKFKFQEKIGKKAIEKQIARAIETAEYTFGPANQTACQLPGHG
jgi:hypothetical protein